MARAATHGEISPLPCLAGAAWLADPRLTRVSQALEREGGSSRVVGGAVRETLLGRKVREIDIATTVLPEDVVRLSEAAGLKPVPTGIDHGTVTVVSDGMPFEVTTLRRDVETDGRRAVVAFTTDWAEDAARRDFTINALYADLDGTLFDPVGGYPDLAARRVRFIGDPETRIREDYLRILRLFRFHAEIGRGYLDPEGLAAARALSQGLSQLSRERVRQELLRLLGADGAGTVVPVMQSCGVLDALGLGVPDLSRFARLIEIEQKADLDGDGLLRLAALLLGSARGDTAKGLADKLRLTSAETERLAALAGYEDVSPANGAQARRELIYRAGAATAWDRVMMAWAEGAAAGDDPDWRELLALTTSWTPPEFPIKGRDLIALGFAKGPKLGAALETLERYWIDQQFKPGRDELLTRAKSMAGE